MNFLFGWYWAWVIPVPRILKEVANTKKNIPCSGRRDGKIIVHHEYTKSFTEILVPVICDDICKKLKEGNTFDNSNATT